MKERGRLWRNNSVRGLAHWQTWAAFVVSLIWSFLVFLSIDYLRDEVFHTDGKIYAILHGLGFGIGFYFFMCVWIEKVRPYIKKEINN
jgi:hypothetical protein